MVRRLIFLDTSFIVALVNNSDDRHNKAVKLASKIQNEEKIVSNIVIIEVLNILRKFKDGKLNKEVFRIIKDNFQIYLEDMGVYDDALNIQLRYKGKLGFSDSIMITIMKRMNIVKIASYDRHFDGKEGIVRIH